ncbi:hypothetical protein OQA88_1448 [Cercophora sp. LCS_1]
MSPEGTPAGDISPVHPSSDLATEHKKRNRIRFSCTHCREKKLKCNRQTPCDQCLKREIAATCQFIPYENSGGRTPPITTRLSTPASTGINARAKANTSDSALQARLRHLEHLVQVLKSQHRAPGHGSLGEDNLPIEFVRYTEKAGLRSEDQRYLHADDWESIVDEITILTRDLRTDDDPFDHFGHVYDSMSTVQGPALLVGGFPRAIVAELIALLPPQPVVDRLIARFFAAKEPAWMVFHVPTFMRDYKAFWENPLDTSYTWLALIFSMCAQAALFSSMADDPAVRDFRVFDDFRVRAAQALTLADYTKPGPYKVQAMLMYFGCEYLRRSDSILGTSTLLAIVIRLAMHMGMHRDPKHYPDMTPLEGEMRRRMWMLLREIDLLVSFQFSIPSNIHPSSYDTAPPRNLHDHDVDERSTELPPSRPETERTVTLMSIVKGRLMDVFDAITHAVSAHDPATYAEILQIDKRLADAHARIPEILQYRPLSQSLVDPIELTMQRYWLELLYQKCRAVLHRKYLCLARRDLRFTYSRRMCIDAAMQTLRHQRDIHGEMQPGGRLSNDRWFLSSLSVHDFLLASMILCLELAFVKAKEKSPESTAIALKEFAEDKSPDVLAKAELLEILSGSRKIWQSARRESAEANRAFKILSKMLAMSTGEEIGASPESSGSSDRPDWYAGPPRVGNESSSILVPPAFSSVGSEFATPDSTNDSPAWGSSSANGTGQADGQAPIPWGFEVPSISIAEIPSLDTLETMVDPTLGSDWSLWDNQIQNPNIDTYQMPWNTFFTPP